MMRVNAFQSQYWLISPKQQGSHALKFGYAYGVRLEMSQGMQSKPQLTLAEQRAQYDALSNEVKTFLNGAQVGDKTGLDLLKTLQDIGGNPYIGEVQMRFTPDNFSAVAAGLKTMEKLRLVRLANYYDDDNPKKVVVIEKNGDLALKFHQAE